MIKDGRPYTCEGGCHDTKLLTDMFTSFLAASHIEKISNWIYNEVMPARSIHPSSSYTLKHMLASDTGGIYLTNNQFKDAMMLAGYMPVDPNEVNWRYRIKLRKEVVIKNPNPFYRWAMQFKKDESPNGDFVRDMVYDEKQFPVFADYQIIRNYLEWKCNACSEALDCFESLWVQYQLFLAEKES